MPSVLNSKDAFKKGAVYDDDDGKRVLHRAMPKPEPDAEDKLAAILVEIKNAMVQNAQLIARIPSGDNESVSSHIIDFSAHIYANQQIMLQLLNEIKRANTAQENKRPSKWKSTVVRDRYGVMLDIIHVEIKEK